MGYRSMSGEVIVGTKDGVFKSRTIRRRALEHQWEKASLDMVGCVPW